MTTQTTFRKAVNERAKDILAWKRGQDSGDDVGSDYRDVPCWLDCVEDAEKEIVFEWFDNNRLKFRKLYEATK